jgi:hypothetical protein
VKHLIISEIALLSEQEKRARRETLDPKRTIVLGSNETGKSSLLKSIYHAFGAEPAKQHPRWQKAEIKSLVKFSVDARLYMLLRDSSYYALFSGDGVFLKSFTRITGDLSPYLAQIFDFGLVLSSRQEDPEIPPPAFLFLPFYMDQDASWQNPWSGFDKLYQYANWKESLVEYHTGIRDNAYYAVSAQAIKKQSRLGELTGEAKSVESVARKLEADATTAAFNLNPDVFSDQIKRLLAESEKLRGHENELKEQLTRLNAEQALQKTRLAIANQALGELSNDFRFLTHSTTDEIECPTCGNHYENDFVVRFSIASDEDRVAEFIAHITAEIARLGQEIEKAYEKYSIAKAHAQKIQSILAEKQGELTLSIVIESEGRRAAENLLSDQLNSIQEEGKVANAELEKIKGELRAHNAKSSGIRKEVMEQYERSLRSNFLSLGVNSFSDGVFKSLVPHLIEIGSTLPRALLAYQFTIVELISKRSPSTVCPMVIDSPNQQAQDKDSLTRILRFISDNQPPDTQLILGLENDLGIAFGGKTIATPVSKYRLLQEDQYDSVHAEIFGLLKNSLRS